MCTVKLKPGVELSGFDDNLEEPSYLVSYFNKNWKVKKIVYDVIFQLQNNKIEDEKDANHIISILSQNEIEVTIDEVNFIINFLKSNGLIVGYEPEKDKDKPLRDKMIWARITLIPSTITKKFSLLKFLFDKLFFSILITLFIAWFIYMYMINSPSIVGEKLMKLYFTELVLSYIFLIFTGFAHEIGHAVALMKHGENPGRIGAAMYFIMPVLFADVTRAWKLSRKARVMVDIGGIYFQGLILMISYIINELFINSHLLTIGIMLSTIAIIGNFNPFIKMDGYWIFSDILGVENLHKLARDTIAYFFEKTKGVPNPISKFKKRQRAIMVVYLVATCAFYVYMMQMIYHALIFGIDILATDLTVLLNGELSYMNIGVGDVMSYLSSRVSVFIALFLAIRMVYMLIKRLAILTKRRRLQA